MIICCLTLPREKPLAIRDPRILASSPPPEIPALSLSLSYPQCSFHSRQRSLQLLQRQMALAVRQSTCIAYAERLCAYEGRPIIERTGLNSSGGGHRGP